MLERKVEIAVGLDTFFIVLFAAAGRRSHDEDGGFIAVIETAAPFLIGLATAWLLVRAWKRPMWLFTGIALWPITLLVGMITRNLVFDRGTATSFVVVATSFIGACLVGWRLLAGVVLRRRSRVGLPTG